MHLVGVGCGYHNSVIECRRIEGYTLIAITRPINGLSRPQDTIFPRVPSSPYFPSAYEAIQVASVTIGFVFSRKEKPDGPSRESKGPILRRSILCWILITALDT